MEIPHLINSDFRVKVHGLTYQLLNIFCILLYY